MEPGDSDGWGTGILMAPPHRGHLTRLPASVSWAVNLLLQEPHCAVIAILLPVVSDGGLEVRKCPRLFLEVVPGSQVLKL